MFVFWHVLCYFIQWYAIVVKKLNWKFLIVINALCMMYLQAKNK